MPRLPYLRRNRPDFLQKMIIHLDHHAANYQHQLKIPLQEFGDFKQELALKALQNLERIRRDSAPSQLIGRIAESVAKKFAKEAKDIKKPRQLPRNIEEPDYRERENLGTAIVQALRTLTKREALIIRRRFGLGRAGRTYTLEDLGRRLGISRERVRQIEARAKRKLREVLRTF